MKLQISDEVRKLFPELRIAVLLASGIDNVGADLELDLAKRKAAQRLAVEFSNESLGQLAEIKAWRQAYRTFGAKPSDSRPTAEAFLRRLIKGEQFPSISKAVDAYLLVQTRYFLPVGGYDLSTITGDVRLRCSPGDEEFTPIGSTAIELTRPGEVVYADDARILTRKWNFRDCDTCKITASSTEIALFTEAPYASVSTGTLQASIDLMAQYLGTSCGGTISTQLLDASTTGEFVL